MKVRIIAKLIYYFIRLLNLTYRYEFIDINLQKIAKKDRRLNMFTYALWHQNIIAAIFSHMNQKFTMIVSESNDGELVAQTCINLGHLPARGSSTRGGQRAMKEMIKNIQNGHPGCITVDGPKGPAREVKFGIIDVAKLTNLPIVPLSPYPKHFWSFKKSWDQFRIPMPFSKILIVIGEPIVIDRKLAKEDYPRVANEIAQAIDLGESKAQEYFNLGN